MKEESRIEALEHELKILKNEIHATLLEIREQILNHYYPELRAEEPLRNHSLPVRNNASRPSVPGVPPAKSTPRVTEKSVTLSEIEAKGQIQPFSDIFLEDLTEDDLADDAEDSTLDDAGIDALIAGRRATVVALVDEYDDDDDDIDDDDNIDELDVKVRKVVPAPRENFGTTPQTREVNFRQLKQAASGEAATPTPSPKAMRANFAALATWVSDGVSRVGKARTTQIIETYASGGKLNAETKSSLLQLVSLAGEDEPVTPAGTQEVLAVMVALDQILGQ